MDKSYKREVEDQLRTRCIHLRTKEGFVGIPSEHEQAFEADTAIFWCDQTGEPLGPDGDAADDTCHGPCDRSCFEPPIRPSVS